VTDEAIAALLERRLEPPAIQILAEHIDRCEPCRALVAEAVRAIDPGHEGTLAAGMALPLPPTTILRSRGREDLVGETSDGAPLPSGSAVGRYVVLECIGAGAMGIVYMARDPQLGRRVALKLLRADPGEVPSPAAYARLQREAQALAQLSHPNVIAIYDVGTLGNGVFIAMELVDGGTLTDWLQERRSWRESVGILRAAGEGLAAAHATGLIHRDFKPDNVLVGKDGRVRVTDFGLARVSTDGGSPIDSRRSFDRSEPVDAFPSHPSHLVESMTRTGTLMGTPAYMAPEQIVRAKADARSDLFSFCVALYEALYGERPFAGSTLGALYEAIMRGGVRAAPSHTKVPGWLRHIVVSGLHADPERRPAHMRALLDSIDRGFSRQRRRVTMATAAAVVVCGGSALLAGAGHRSANTHGSSEPISNGAAARTATADVPQPVSMPVEAREAYESGVQKLHDGDVEGAETAFALASKLDPGLAQAHLRCALLLFAQDAADAREHLARAVDGRRSLGERDRLLLGAAQAWMQAQPADAAAYARLMAEAQARYPLDAELAFYAADAFEESGDHAGAIAVVDRALKAEPGFSGAYSFKAVELMQEGEIETALATIRDCVAHASNPTQCLYKQDLIDLVEGNCERLERTAQELEARDPSSPFPYYHRALAAYALGRSPDAVRELLRQDVVHYAPERRAATEVSRSWALDVLSGDLAASLRRAAELERIAAAVADQRLHARAALWRVMASTEMGRAEEAALEAKRFLQTKDAWVAEPRGDDFSLGQDPVPRMLVAARDGRVFSSDAFERRRQEWVDEWMGKTGPDYRSFVWLHAYAAISQTPEDAARALAELPKYGSAPRFTRLNLGDAYIGETYFLAGRASEALPGLRRAASSCLALHKPFEHTQVHLALGQALAASGQRDEACAAYAVVLARWGKARPRSTTAEKARSLARALGCSEPP
jgi:serine/threonine-protein kinase